MWRRTQTTCGMVGRVEAVQKIEDCGRTRESGRDEGRKIVMANRVKVQKKIKEIKEAVVGHRFRYFKGGTYIVTDVAVDWESKKAVVVFKDFKNGYVWTKPLDAFLAAVDKNLHPGATQEYIFEVVVD